MSKFTGKLISWFGN